MENTVTDQNGRDVEPEAPVRIGERVENGENVELPVVEMLTGRAFATGKSGSGKSNSANVVAEELLERGFALLIIDKEGEYWSLKEEYEILHAGADEECDIQVAPEHGEKLATLALEKNVPIILDISGFFDEDEGDELIYETVCHLFNKEKRLSKPFLIIAEEAHEYIPEQGGGELADMMVRVGKRGRKRGLGLFAISQRPQDVKKSYISQCDWVLWHRLTWNTETKVVRKVVNRETADAVPELDDGEGFLQADFLDDSLQRVQIKRMQTFDAGETPGLDGFDEPELEPVDANLVDELDDISEREERRQDKIERLETQVEERDEQIEELEERNERLLDLRSMVESVDGVGDAPNPAPSTKDLTIEIDGEALSSPEVIEAEVMEIRQEKAEIEKERDELAERVREQQNKISDLQDRLEQLEWLDDHVDEIEEAARRLAKITGLSVDGDHEELQSQLREKDHRIEQLETRLEELREQDREQTPEKSPIVATDDEELNAFLRHDALKEELRVAKKEGDYAPEKYANLLSLVVTSDSGVTPQTAADVLGVSDTTAREVLRDLRMNGFLRSEGERPETFHVDRDRLERRVEVANRKLNTNSDSSV